MSTIAGDWSFDANGSPTVEIVEHYVNGSCSQGWLDALRKMERDDLRAHKWQQAEAEERAARRDAIVARREEAAL